MNTTRNLNCSTSLENDYLCIREQVAGFTNRGPQPGDQVFLSVKVDGIHYCGARFVPDKAADNRPWPDGGRYVNGMTVKDMEYYEPFGEVCLSNLQALPILARAGEKLKCQPNRN